MLFLLLTMNSRIITKFGIFFLNILSRFPFWLIYLLSDLFYLIVFYIVKYRKNVVFENLKYAFPEKTDVEIKILAKKYFHHFCDLTLESIKTGSMKDSDFLERMKLKNAEILDPLYKRGQSAVVLTMHYNNWEWGVFMSEYIKHKILAVYKPLHNDVFDRFIIKTRSKFGIELIKNNQVLRRILIAEKQKEPVCTWLAGDQTPPKFHSLWFIFLNREAMFYQGPAFISKRFNQPVFFMKIEKTKRGRYVTTLELLCSDTGEITETEIIKLYIQKMEEVIRTKPEFYLWSHKRWKHTRPSNVPLQ